MTCKKFMELAYLSEDELDAETISELQRHKAECAACAAEYAQIEHARQAIRDLRAHQPVLTDPMLLINEVVGRIEREAALTARQLPMSAFDRLIVRLSLPATRAAMACALLLIAGSFAFEYTSAFIQMKTLEGAMEKRSALHEQYETAAMDPGRLLTAASDLTKLIYGKQSTAQLSENWIVMNRASLEQFLLLYNDLKKDASRLPPEFREANPGLTKLLETDQQSAQMAVLMKDREALIRELNRLVSSERETP